MEFQIYVFLLVLLQLYYIWSKISQSRSSLLKNPLAVVGGDGYLTSWKTCLKYLFRWPELMREGYLKYDAYQMPTLRGFVTFINNPADLKEFFQSPESVLSLLRPLSEELQTDHTLPGALNRTTQAFLISLIRRVLDKSRIPYDALSEEIQLFLESKVEPTLSDEWSNVQAFSFSMGIASQIDNRVFVGTPLCEPRHAAPCRNKEYLEGVGMWAQRMAIGGQVVKLFPGFLRPFAARYLTSAVTQRQKFEKIMEPIVRDRMKVLTDKNSRNEPGENNSPFLDAMIQGLMGRAHGDLDSSLLARLMLIVNTSALHTTTVVLTTALYELASRPDLGEMLREEYLQKVGDCNGNENAAAITTDLPMLDSFLKEVVRMTPPGHATSFREVLKDFTFSSGLHVPAGVTLAVPTHATYRDPRLYHDPDTFNPLRFYNQHAENKHGGTSFIDTSISDYVFSHGVHTCPGRWFASAGMKLVLINLLERYEIRFEKGKSKPRGISFQASFTPNMTAKIQLRRRRDS
ncbi:hypothetical protein Q9L58_008964 [Maublancomyces gigas]|uniref:Cytochrome P450 n=1 Tax=Discina gigas TaxID=1032678 RepID=A0ABR3G9B3_9PEZI